MRMRESKITVNLWETGQASNHDVLVPQDLLQSSSSRSPNKCMIRCGHASFVETATVSVNRSQGCSKMELWPKSHLPSVAMEICL